MPFFDMIDTANTNTNKSTFFGKILVFICNILLRVFAVLIVNVFIFKKVVVISHEKYFTTFHTYIINMKYDISGKKRNVFPKLII